MRNLPLAVALIALALGAPATVRAAAITGTVILTPADLSFRGGMKQNAYVGQLGGSAGRPAAGDPSDTTYGVAYLADVAEATASPAGPAMLDQKGQRFIPRLLAVVVGQAVDFRNSDNVFHNVFSYSPPKRFDLGRYPRGKSKRLTFQKPGLVQVFCDIHSDMRADIVVVPSRCFGYVDATGRFRIEDAPAGEHTVIVWLPRRGERRGEIVVPESGAVDFAMGAE
jgi:plastocyanin